MSELNKNEIVEELNEISNLYAQRTDAEEAMLSVMEKEEKAQKEQRFKIAAEVSHSAGESEEAFNVRTPALSPIAASFRISGRTVISKKKVIKGGISGLVLLVVSVALLIMMISGYKSVGISFLTVVLFFASGIFYLLNVSDLHNYIDYIDRRKKWYNKLSNIDFEAVDKSFFEECKKIDEDFCQVENEYKKMLLVKLDELEHAKEKTEEQFYDEKVKILKKVNIIDDELKKHTEFSPEYYDKAEKIARILKNNRADTLKEALNLAIEEARMDEEEQNRQREREAALLLEAKRIEAERMAFERQTKIMEQQAENARRAAEEQNRILERQAQEAKRDEERRQISADLDARAERIANETAKSNAYRQCMVCANRSGCRVQGTVNCGAFVPKSR